MHACKCGMKWFSISLYNGMVRFCLSTFQSVKWTGAGLINGINPTGNCNQPMKSSNLALICVYTQFRKILYLLCVGEINRFHGPPHSYWDVLLFIRKLCQSTFRTCRRNLGWHDVFFACRYERSRRVCWREVLGWHDVFCMPVRALKKGMSKGGFGVRILNFCSPARATISHGNGRIANTHLVNM